MHHLDFISQFTSDIRHVTRQGNPVADALSCLEVNAMPLDSASPTVDFQAMAKAHPDVTSLLLYNPYSLQTVLSSSPESLCLCAQTHSFVTPLQEDHIPTFHSNFDIQCSTPCTDCYTQVSDPLHRWACSCLQCQRAKVHCHTTTFNTPDARFTTCTLTSSDPCQHHKIALTSSFILIALLGGQKPYQYLTSLQTQ